jgi:hypothetical protein
VSKIPHALRGTSTLPTYLPTYLSRLTSPSTLGRIHPPETLSVLPDWDSRKGKEKGGPGRKEGEGVAEGGFKHQQPLVHRSVLLLVYLSRFIMQRR